MSKHNRDRRKYSCPCGNRFSTAMVEETEAFATIQRNMGKNIPKRIPHSCGRCQKISCLDGGRLRYLTPSEELTYRIDFPQAADLQDVAMEVDAPDFIGAIPLEKTT